MYLKKGAGGGVICRSFLPEFVFLFSPQKAKLKSLIEDAINGQAEQTDALYYIRNYLYLSSNGEDIKYLIKSAEA
jgi:hypothetical protein